MSSPVVGVDPLVPPLDKNPPSVGSEILSLNTTHHRKHVGLNISNDLCIGKKTLRKCWAKHLHDCLTLKVRRLLFTILAISVHWIVQSFTSVLSLVFAGNDWMALNVL